MYGHDEHSMRCSECKEATDIFVDPRAGEIICRGCGVVLGERCIDDGQEWRTFTSDDHAGRADPNRCGDVASPLLSASSNMNTVIEGGKSNQQTTRLKRLQGLTTVETASEVALKACFARVREIAHGLGLPSSIQEDACLLLRRAEDDGLFKSKKDPRGKAMCAAVTYITCRTWGVSRTMKDLSKAVDLSLRDVNKACKHLFKNLNIDRGTVRGTHLIPQLCGKLSFPPFITIAAQHVAQEASALDLVGGMGPAVVAAAAVLLICSCWKPEACRAGARRGGAGGKGRKILPEEEQEEVGADREKLAVGPAAVSVAQDVSMEAMKRPFQAMYDERMRLVTPEFMEKYVPKGVTLETLQPVLG